MDFDDEGTAQCPMCGSEAGTIEIGDERQTIDVCIDCGYDQ